MEADCSNRAVAAFRILAFQILVDGSSTEVGGMRSMGFGGEDTTRSGRIVSAHGRGNAGAWEERGAEKHGAEGPRLIYIHRLA